MGSLSEIKDEQQIFADRCDYQPRCYNIFDVHRGSGYPSYKIRMEQLMKLQQRERSLNIMARTGTLHMRPRSQQFSLRE